MNYKKLVSFLFIFAISPIIFCEESKEIEINDDIESEETNEIKTKSTTKNFSIYKFFIGPAIAVFHSQDKLYKEIHQEETLTPMIQIQANISPHFSLWSDLGFFYNDGYFADANTIQSEPKAKIYHLFFGLGVKAQMNFSNDANIFLKAGPSLMYYHRKQNLPATPSTISKTGFGATIGTGIQAPIKNNFYITIFGDYMFNEKTVKNPKYPTRSKRINLGGFLTGLGLQYKF